MARPAATLSSDDQRALERAVSNAVSCAQSLNAPLDPTLKTKKKKTKRSQGGTAETGDKTTHKEKRKKQSGVDDASVPRSGESRQGKEEKRDRRRVKLAHQAERGQGTDDELIGSAREQQEQAVMTQQDTQETVTSAPNKKKKKKDKGKQPAIEEAAAISTAADDAPPSFDMAYTSPHSLLSTLFSTAPSLPLPAPDTMDLEQVLLPQGMVPPPGPSPLPYLVNGVPQAMNDTAAQDLNQLLMDLNIAIGTPTIEDPTPSTAALSVPPEELLRIIEALSTLDANKIPGVYKTLNDALAQSAPGQTPASTSGALISIPAPGSLPPGHERAPLPPRSIPRARAQMITTPALVPTPIHQAPRTSESILGNNNVPLSAGIPHAGSGQQTSDAHAHMLAHKWLTSAQLSELVRKEGLVYKKGKFSKVEDQLLEEAINTYRQDNGLTEEQVKDIMFAKDKGKDASFWSELTLAVPGRPIIAVYHHLRRTHHPLRGEEKKHAWTADEDARLQQAVLQHGPAWERVSETVGRMAVHCRDRYRNHLAEKNTRNTGTWSKQEEDELIQIISEMTAQGGDQDEIFWGRVSQRMGGKRGRQQCRVKWLDQLQQRVKSDSDAKRWNQRDAYILIHKIDSLNIQHDSEIDWKSLPDPSWNIWSPHLIQLRWRTMKESVKGWEHMSHAEIMSVLREKKGYLPPPPRQQPRKETSAPEIPPEMEHDDAANPILPGPSFSSSSRTPVAVTARIDEGEQINCGTKSTKKKKRKHREDAGDVNESSPRATSKVQGDTSRKKIRKSG